MSRYLRKIWVSLCAVALSGGLALADHHEGGDDDAMADGGAAHGLTLPKGKIAIHGVVEVNMSKDAVGKPFSIAPDIWYGVSDKLTVGVVHSGFGATGFLGGVGNGLCLAGEEKGCAEVYDNVGFEGKFSLKAEPNMSLAAVGGVHLLTLSDPMFADLKLGLAGAWRSGKISVMFAPSIFIGLTERDFNKEILFIPVGAMFAANPKLAVGAQTGIAGPLDGFGDAYIVPLSLGGHYAVSDKVMVGAAFSFLNIAGKESSADFRALNLMLGYMM
jgi:hypothetical protein